MGFKLAIILACAKKAKYNALYKMTVRIHGSLVLFCMFLFCSGTKHTSSIRDGHAILHRSDRLKSVPKPIDSDVSAE